MAEDLETRKSVLIVEDVVVTALALSDALEDAGYRVLAHCSSAAEAMAVLAHATPDFAILDLTLRGSSCLEVARDLRGLGVPFLVHSGWSPLMPLPEELKGALWLEKPVSFDALVHALQALEPQVRRLDAREGEARSRGPFESAAAQPVLSAEAGLISR